MYCLCWRPSTAGGRHTVRTPKHVSQDESMDTFRTWYEDALSEDWLRFVF